MTRGNSCEVLVSRARQLLESRSHSSHTSAAFQGGLAVTDENRDSFKTLCHSYPVDLIASWCEVDIATARHYKAGTREPGKSAYRLFLLYREGRVLPADWEGFSFRNGVMWDPYGKPFTRQLLMVYGIAWQIFREWTRDDPVRRRTLDELQGVRLPKAGVPALAGAEPKASKLAGRKSETVRRAFRQTPLPR